MTHQNLQKSGILLASIYIALQPLMLQNPLKPVLGYGLGALQVADVLFLPMLIWVGGWFWSAGRSGDLRAQMSGNWLVFVALGGVVASFMLSGAGAGYTPKPLDIAKYGYLAGVLAFFVLISNSPAAIVPIFRVLVYASIAYMIISLGYYIAAYVYGYASDFAQIREGFPYLDRVVRLNGPMKPTAKIFGMYLLVLSLLLMLGRDLIDPRVWRLALGLSALCGLLTLGRAGLAAAAAVIFGIASLSSHRARWLTFLAFPALTAAVVIQLLTIFHIDAMHSILACNGEYAVERQTQYFGWYKEPGMCRFSFEGGVAYSSYFLLKLVALNAWLSEPYLGIGVCQFADAWRSAAGVDVPGYFANDLFTMSQCTYLTLLAEVGLLGTAAWFSLIGLFLWRTWTGARKNISTQWVFLTWAACFFYAMVDLDVQNFRFLYSLLPLAATMSVHAASKSVRTEAHQEG